MSEPVNVITMGFLEGMRGSTPEENEAYRLMLDRMSTRLAPESELDVLRAENDKLRRLLSLALIVAGFDGRQYLDAYMRDEDGTTLWDELREVGIEAGEDE